jgi:hypothetical protein
MKFGLYNEGMKKKITTIEDLAILVQKEFLAVGKRFDKIEYDIKDLKHEVLELRSDMDDLKLRMGEFAYRFEFKDFEKRLRRVEAKVGVRS